jgi:hypothetical protein
MRVAVALGPDARVKGARIVEVDGETYPWVRAVRDLVKSHQVVRGDNPGDRGLANRRGVRPMPVVVMQPRGESAGALFGVAIEAHVRPLKERGLDEALRLAVGPGV